VDRELPDPAVGHRDHRDDPLSVTVTRPEPPAPRSQLWAVGRVLLLASVVALIVAVFFGLWPVDNPGVQNCGSPAVYTVRNVADVRIPGPGAADEPPNAEALRAQPRCRDRVDQALGRGAMALGFGIALGVLGAVLGLVDDRLTYARAPRFESFLRERPAGVPADAWDRPVIPEDDLGTRLPDLEWVEIRLVLVVGLAALSGLAWATPWAEVRVALGSASIGWLVAAVMLMAVAYPVAAIETMAFTDGLTAGRQAFVSVLAAGVASSFTGRLLPEYGPEGLAVHQLVRAGVPRDDAVARFAILDLLAVATHGVLVVVVGVVVVMVGPAAGRPLERGWLVWLVVVGLAVAGLVTARRRYRNRVIRPDRRALDDLVGADPRLVVTPAAAAAALALINAAAVVALVRGFGGGGSWMAIVAASLLAGVAVIVAPTPDGVGLVEPVLALTLIAAGVDAGPAVAAVVIWRLLGFWVPMLPGWLAYRRLRDDGVL
jgi:uncharacterized membrane protein YbhN (UPF0104 family)